MWNRVTEIGGGWWRIFFKRQLNHRKHPWMVSIEQMYPLLHNGQSWMHTRAPKPPVPGKTRRPKAHCGKPGSPQFQSGDLQIGIVLNFIATTNVPKSDASES
ncbi:hypothetical protein Hanom_Chr13g01192281 [Helianthus anomalus]